MTEKLFKTVGEGGAHAHRLSPTRIETEKDGIHKHLFFIDDRLMMTDLSGAHVHSVSVKENSVGMEKEKHSHTVTIRTNEGPVDVSVSEGEPHQHELQSEMTTLSGVHRHTMELMEQIFISLVPGDLIEEVMAQAKSSKQFKNLTLPNLDEPMETNFSLVKKLNQNKFKNILQKAVEKSIIKRMASLGEGLRIESLILSKERFADVGVATRFVLDQGLDVKSSQVLMEQGVFTFQVMSREAFEETTLQRIRITEGVEAVIGFLAEPEKASVGMTQETVASSENGDSLTDVEQSNSDDLISEEKNDTIDKSKKGKANMESLKSKFAKTMSSFDTEKEAKKDAVLKTNKSFKMTYQVISKNNEKRLITGPVLVPDNIDLQDDIVSADEIEKAAHGYMIKLAYRDEPEFLKSLGFRNVDKAGERGFQHMDFSRKMAVVETFIAPVDMVINGRTITKGTWVMTMKVFDDEVWNLVKAGKITGFSIGGHSKSRPVTNQE